MAIENSTTATIIPFPAGQFGAQSRLATCAYCERPLTKRVIAASKPYCGDLCAAFGLIRRANEQNAINDLGCEALEAGVDRLLRDKELVIPVIVRDSDVERGLAELSGKLLIVSIADEGTPDWQPATTTAC